MTSNRKVKKQQPSSIEAHRLINRQFYRRMEVMDYPDIIHVKNDDPHRSDVVCFKTFGQCYMDMANRIQSQEQQEISELKELLKRSQEHLDSSLGRIDRLMKRNWWDRLWNKGVE